MLGDAMAQKATPQRYTAEVARALAAKMPDAKVTVLGEFELSVKETNGRERGLNLRNRYSDYRSKRATLDKIVDGYYAALNEPSSQEAATPAYKRIVPVIKDRTWLADNERSLKARGVTASFLFDEFNDQLVIVYALDETNRMRYLMANERLPVERKDLRRLAVQNLGDILPDVQMRQLEGVILLKAGGDYEASLLLFDGIWRDGPVKVDGDIIVAVPSKDVLLVTGSNNRKGIETLRVLAAKLKAESRYEITDTLFVYRDGRFTRFAGN
jgi:uncharacterized protein YtpQ (UPF0354 family)